jgi:hypothetical protein
VRNPLIKAEANDFSLIDPYLSGVDLSKNKKREQGADDGEQSLAVQHPSRAEAVAATCEMKTVAIKTPTAPG